MRTLVGRLADLDLKNRLTVMIAVPVTLLTIVGLAGVLLPQSTLGRLHGGLALAGAGLTALGGWKIAASIVEALTDLADSAERLADGQRALLANQTDSIEVWRPMESADTLVAPLSAALGALKSGSTALWTSRPVNAEPGANGPDWPDARSVPDTDQRVEGDRSVMADTTGEDGPGYDDELVPLSPLDPAGPGPVVERAGVSIHDDGVIDLESAGAGQGAAAVANDELAEMLHQDWQAQLRKGVAALVTDLARRHQTLLDRQIELIDGLELAEQDPERLESLFAVDHLAGRMRRVSESLLVLADAEPRRRRGRPVDTETILQLAVGEIENYRQVEIGAVEPGLLAPGDAWTLSHLCAELLENATQFSSPDGTTTVTGRLRDDVVGVDEPLYIMEIVDHGIGMSGGQLLESNAILADPPELDVAIGRPLGLIVVGRLARRLGATVRLSSTRSGPGPEVPAGDGLDRHPSGAVVGSGGVTATIALPVSLLVPLALPDTDDPTVDGAAGDDPAARSRRPPLPPSTARLRPPESGSPHADLESPTGPPAAEPGTDDSGFVSLEERLGGDGRRWQADDPAPIEARPASEEARSGPEGAPSRLDEALPTGHAFESGLADLLGSPTDRAVFPGSADHVGELRSTPAVDRQPRDGDDIMAPLPEPAPGPGSPPPSTLVDDGSAEPGSTPLPSTGRAGSPAPPVPPPGSGGEPDGSIPAPPPPPSPPGEPVPPGPPPPPPPARGVKTPVGSAPPPPPRPAPPAPPVRASDAERPPPPARQVASALPPMFPPMPPDNGPGEDER